MGRQSSFHPAAPVLEHRSGFLCFLLLRARFALSLAVTAFPRVKSSPTDGTDAVIAHKPCTFLTSSGRAPRHWTEHRPSVMGLPLGAQTGGAYHAQPSPRHNTSWPLGGLTDSSGQHLLLFMAFSLHSFLLPAMTTITQDAAAAKSDRTQPPSGRST